MLFLVGLCILLLSVFFLLSILIGRQGGEIYDVGIDDRVEWSGGSAIARGVGAAAIGTLKLLAAVRLVGLVTAPTGLSPVARVAADGSVQGLTILVQADDECAVTSGVVKETSVEYVK